MYFASDNAAGAHQKISDSLLKHSSGFAGSYGASDLDKKVEAKFSEIFETDVHVFFVSTGTAANALALSASAKAGGIAICHEDAHVIEDECGAPEFFTGGCRLTPVAGEGAKISSNTLSTIMSDLAPENVHHGRLMATTITQATELGTLYTADEISALADICHQHNVPLHMDGARFANAIVSSNVTPAQMTWRSGVDYVSFGGTKNGCWCAEALICFDKEKAHEISYMRKRAGQLFSKSRFVAAQFDAYFEDDLWLDLARHSNLMAQKLSNGFENSSFADLAYVPQSNEVFVVMSPAKALKLRGNGAVFYEWPLPRSHSSELSTLVSSGKQLYRFVTSFQTTPEDIIKLTFILNAD